MAEMVICDERQDEMDEIAYKAKDINAYVSDTKLNIHEFVNGDSLRKAVSCDLNTDMAVTSVPESGDTSVPETVRSSNEDASIMLVTDASVSLVRYLTPKVRACSLLLRPFSESACEATLKDFMSDYYIRNRKDNKAIVVESSGKKENVRISQIYYVEVRGKRVFLRLRNKELCEYATFENILEKLGPDFVRCHRSFAFNRLFFESVKISENLIKLSHGLSVPLSRTYKSKIREFVNGR